MYLPKELLKRILEQTGEWIDKTSQESPKKQEIQEDVRYTRPNKTGTQNTCAVRESNVCVKSIFSVTIEVMISFVVDLYLLFT